MNIPIDDRNKTFNTKTNSPLEDDKIISGYLGLVAICVTQPLCPKRVPFNCIVSAIVSQIDKIVAPYTLPSTPSTKKKTKYISYSMNDPMHPSCANRHKSPIKYCNVQQCRRCTINRFLRVEKNVW